MSLKNFTLVIDSVAALLIQLMPFICQVIAISNLREDVLVEILVISRLTENVLPVS